MSGRSGQPRRVLIAAGEASGDQHGAGLVREVLKRDPTVQFFGLAGPAMKQAGVEPLVEVSDVAVVGILEVARHLPRIYRGYRTLTNALAMRRPDLVLPIDYPDFNLRVARRARGLEIPVLYFVSPQVWAWRRGRVRTIARRVDRMMVLFRFEEQLYREAGVPVTWVGHPLADGQQEMPARRDARGSLGLPERGTVIALMPGSRLSEVRRILPVLLRAAEILSQDGTGLSFVMPAAPTLDSGELASLSRGHPVRVVPGRLEEVLAAADAAAVASGTATLQVALSGTPMVIVYRVSPLTALIGRRLISVADIGLANLVAGRRVAEELVQEDCTPERVARALSRLLNPAATDAARKNLALVRAGLGEAGAFARAAEETLAMLVGAVDGARRESV
jgi:lipid-A-disaccharide synthase